MDKKKLHPVDKAKMMGVTTHSWGINWGWIEGFNKVQSEEFIKWLDDNDYEHRGIYSNDDNTYSIRYR